MNNTISFPIGTPTEWTVADNVIIPDPHLKNWLLDTGSLTERLQSHCRHFNLQLLGQRHLMPELEELKRLDSCGENNKQDWQIREVVLHGEGVPWVFARSVIPDELCQADLVDLGERPLGQIIFNDPRFKRSPFEVCKLYQVPDFFLTFGLDKQTVLWGRRSVFQYLHYKMMVAEIFLPQAPAYKMMTGSHHHVSG